MELLIWLGVIAIIIWLIYCHYKKTTSRHTDSRGYERDGYDKLVHRNVAYRQLFNGSYAKRFGSYDIRHIDKNKLNNHPSNLKILTRDEHKKEHGF